MDEEDGQVDNNPIESVPTQSTSNASRPSVPEPSAASIPSNIVMTTTRIHIYPFSRRIVPSTKQTQIKYQKLKLNTLVILQSLSLYRDHCLVGESNQESFPAYSYIKEDDLWKIADID
ncbi:hypothetical protein H8B09_26650 [Paenibacillus sp. PR3]|uniref:Uncharacterized protein n=1 Tax=Paenibacillus terricola TaxID=2763503 RepID=A0ABR8N2H9_9BACL|nr:hypothetical protein [Paenibacillus terricola]MBD3922361.1 hypothetical protein [Paenibacillus terricola]